MKIVLIQPPFDHYGERLPPQHFPLGLGYVSRALQDGGHDVEVFDIWAHQYTKEQVTQKIQELKYDLAGITGFSIHHSYVKWLTRELKKQSKNAIMIGGALATLSPKVVLENTNADICVIGEGEVTCKEIAEHPNKLESVNGIWFKKDGKIVKNPLRDYIKDLDTIKYPAWDLFPMEIYLKTCEVSGYTHLKAMNVLTGRGCPYRCNFCSKQFVGVRVRTIDNVIKEIEELKRKYNIQGITFDDELFIVNRQRAFEFCDKIEPLKITWECQGRVNIVTLELLKRMKKAGCVGVGYGVESGSPTILKNMNKQIKLEQVVEATRNTVKAGMRPLIKMMYGYLGETRGTLNETVNFLGKLPYAGWYSSFAELSATIVLPGTEIYDYALKNRLIVNEDEYLEQLVSKRRPLINLTTFSETELHSLKTETEKRIAAKYFRKYPFHIIRDYVVLTARFGRKYGVRETFRRVIQRFRRSIIRL